jgi:hypothetical protein
VQTLKYRRECAAEKAATLFTALCKDAKPKISRANRGSGHASQTALLLADLGVTKSPRRSRTSNDNPFSARNNEMPGGISTALRLHPKCQGSWRSFFDRTISSITMPVSGG